MELPIQKTRQHIAAINTAGTVEESTIAVSEFI
jgi:hypothetical protein